jgi:predicted permease
MSSFVDIVLPVFALLGVGYAAGASGFFDAAATRALSRFVFTIALPVMLFSSMASQGPPRDFSLSYLVAFFVGVGVSAALGAIAARRLGSRNAAERAVIGFASSYGNVILLGIPLVLRALGESASLPLFMLVSFHGPLMMTIVTILLERSGAMGSLPRRVLAIGNGLMTNPILMSLIGGLVFAALGLSLPPPVAASADLLGRAALPTALFAMGSSLADYRIQGAIRLAAVIVVLKTTVQPIVVWLLVDRVFAIPSPWSDTAILLSAMPTGVNAYLFAARYQAGEPEAATAILLSTAFSLLTVSVILALRLG